MQRYQSFHRNHHNRSYIWTSKGNKRIKKMLCRSDKIIPVWRLSIERKMWSRASVALSHHFYSGNFAIGKVVALRRINQMPTLVDHRARRRFVWTDPVTARATRPLSPEKFTILVLTSRETSRRRNNRQKIYDSPGRKIYRSRRCNTTWWSTIVNPDSAFASESS